MTVQHPISCLSLFFFNDTATTEIYTLSLHDALPIYDLPHTDHCPGYGSVIKYAAATVMEVALDVASLATDEGACRSEEHTSELQSHVNLVCRLLLEKKKHRAQKNSKSMIP